MKLIIKERGVLGARRRRAHCLHLRVLVRCRESSAPARIPPSREHLTASCHAQLRPDVDACQLLERRQRNATRFMRSPKTHRALTRLQGRLPFDFCVRVLLAARVIICPLAKTRVNQRSETITLPNVKCSQAMPPPWMVRVETRHCRTNAPCSPPSRSQSTRFLIPALTLSRRTKCYRSTI